MTELNDHSSRAHALLSASSAHRWLACPPSAVAAEAYPNQDTDYTREGTLAHEIAEAYARAALEGRKPENVRAFAADPLYAYEMLECAQGYADYIQEQIKSDAATVLLEQRVDFSPWVPDGFGTADCIILQGDTMDVIDYKYGQGVAVSAEHNPQEQLYGLGALNDYGLAYDVKHVRLHIYQPRINNVSAFALPAEELLAWGDKTVKPVAKQAAKGKGKYCAGDWCKFCPHAGRCRELTKTCTEYVQTHQLRVAVPVLAPYEVADVLRMEPLVSLWLKRVRDQALSTLLAGGEVPGYKVVEGRGSRAWVDELQVAKTLQEAGYSREDITETSLLSVAKMEKAIGKKKAAELLAEQIEKRAGAPTLAPETDKRPVYDRKAEALKDFEEAPNADN